LWPLATEIAKVPNVDLPKLDSVVAINNNSTRLQIQTTWQAALTECECGYFVALCGYFVALIVNHHGSESNPYECR